MRIEIFCRLMSSAAIVDTIRGAAHTGHPGDGKIFVARAIRVPIRTGEEGSAVLLCGYPAEGAHG